MPHTRFLYVLRYILVVRVVTVRFNVCSASETNGFSVTILLYRTSNKLLHEHGTSFMWHSRETVLISHSITFSFWISKGVTESHFQKKHCAVHGCTRNVLMRSCCSYKEDHCNFSFRWKSLLYVSFSICDAAEERVTVLFRYWPGHPRKSCSSLLHVSFSQAESRSRVTQRTPLAHRFPI